MRLVIVGGGFAGFWAAAAAAREADAEGGELDVTLVSRDQYLVLRPRLYESDPSRFREPLGPRLAAIGVRLRLGEVTEIDAAGRRISVNTENGAREWIEYDRLVLAAGSAMVVPDVPGLDRHSWNIDTVEAATAFDGHLRDVSRHPSGEGQKTFVIVGGGATGIELATEMRTRIEAHSDAETAARARIVLVERAKMVGPELGDEARPTIEEALSQAGVELRMSAEITKVDAQGLTLKSGERIAAATVVVAAGMKPSPLARALDVVRDELGRLPADDFLKVVGVEGIYACGDIARAHVDETHLALMSCQHALQMGRFAGSNAARDLLALPLRPYRQPRYVTCLDLGRAGAVFTNGWRRKVGMTGAKAKEIKRMINTQAIVPPPADRAAILTAAAIKVQPAID